MGIRYLLAHWYHSVVALMIAMGPTAQQPLPAQGVGVDGSRLEGSWTGSLDVGAIRLRLVFNLQGMGNQPNATLDSPDQGAFGIPWDDIDLDGQTIKLVSKKMAAEFSGKLDTQGTQIQGTWSQRGREFPLKLVRAVGSTQRARPQTPRPPFPYQVEEVVYPHRSSGFVFAGTLTLPVSEKPAPAVILISGSGAQDRDESIFEHKPFAVLADRLTRSGMVVLRVDDRGVGGTGHDENPDDDTTADFAGDVRSGLEFLRRRSEVDPKRVGLIGHSEGALVGAMVAAEDNDLAFLMMLAGPGVPGHEMLTLQSEKIARASGVSEQEITNLRTLQSSIFSIIRNQPDIGAGKREARILLQGEYAKLTEKERKAVGSVDSFVEQHLSIIGIPWFRNFIVFDPQTVLVKVTCPVLALTGSKDLQVPPEQNLPRINQCLTQGQARDVTIKELAGLNHLLQNAQTGLVTEYGEIEETISPSALDQITAWLVQRQFASH